MKTFNVSPQAQKGAKMITANMSAQSHQHDGGSPTKQVKVSVPVEVASAFKALCFASGISMAAELTRFMADFSKTAISRRKTPPDYSTKRQRRAAIHKLVCQLEQIRDCEEQYRDRIPENLQSSAAFGNAEEFISLLDTAIEALDSIESI
jgi:hypothetical protein